jgi:hypothetical protein
MLAILACNTIVALVTSGFYGPLLGAECEIIFDVHFVSNCCVNSVFILYFEKMENLPVENGGQN